MVELTDGKKEVTAEELIAGLESLKRRGGEISPDLQARIDNLSSYRLSVDHVFSHLAEPESAAISSELAEWSERIGLSALFQRALDSFEGTHIPSTQTKVPDLTYFQRKITPEMREAAERLEDRQVVLIPPGLDFDGLTFDLGRKLKPSLCQDSDFGNDRAQTDSEWRMAIVGIDSELYRKINKSSASRILGTVSAHHQLYGLTGTDRFTDFLLRLQDEDHASNYTVVLDADPITLKEDDKRNRLVALVTLSHSEVRYSIKNQENTVINPIVFSAVKI